ncbi:hypothetical protein HD595_002539 [Nonomuraea roseoviolacea subsp. carminata]|uniref:Uncharacterized protein n=1 Tax=Nonomuraea roseoviolacea subsp. carminata TaxID=160689 RepID=A0ABT1JYK5_9ACTN|nr:hypothetical protein [Nonomuraea roseoviolacea subsp. carminata]
MRSGRRSGMNPNTGHGSERMAWRSFLNDRLLRKRSTSAMTAPRMLLVSPACQWLRQGRVLAARVRPGPPDRRAIRMQQAGETKGQPRSLMAHRRPRSAAPRGMIHAIPKLTARVRFPSPALRAKAQVRDDAPAGFDLFQGSFQSPAQPTCNQLTEVSTPAEPRPPSLPVLLMWRSIASMIALSAPLHGVLTGHAASTLSCSIRGPQVLERRARLGPVHVAGVTQIMEVQARHAHVPDHVHPARMRVESTAPATVRPSHRGRAAPRLVVEVGLRCSGGAG